MQSYVVTRPFPDSNVGSNLSSLAGAAWLARRLDRTLLVDWRGQRQLNDPDLNYFAEFFATPSTVAGVPTAYAPLGGVSYGPDEPDARWLSPAEAREAGTRGAGEPARHLVLQPYHGLDRLHPGSPGERFALLRQVYGDIAPGAAVSSAVETFAAAELAPAAVVIGLNVRTGNGQYFRPGMRYAGRVDVSLFDRPTAFLRLVERGCRARLARFPPELRGDFRIFYATDSLEMSELLASLPNAVTRRRRFPPAGEGDLYAFDDAGYTDRDSIVDTLADMFLLARCDALVWNFSLFNQYARTTTAYFGGNHALLDALPWRRRVRAAIVRARAAVRG